MIKKINEAKEILKALGLPSEQRNKIASLSFLALAGVKPRDRWSQATNKSLTLSKDIIEFVNNYYDENYKTNTRESFRKGALNPFVDYNIAQLNRDNPDLPRQSSKTHYSLTNEVLNIIRNFETDKWSVLVNNFKNETVRESYTLRKIKIQNFKSILNDTIDLGKFNVFIGSNGCGKTNILEAITFVAASRDNDLNPDGLYSRGFRIAKPSLIYSSFKNFKANEDIFFELVFEDTKNEKNVRFNFTTLESEDIFSKWMNLYGQEEKELVEQISLLMGNYLKINKTKNFANIKNTDIEEYINNNLRINEVSVEPKYDAFISEFLIYCANTNSLRGFNPQSWKTPLGIYGEGLDTVISNFNKKEMFQLRERFYLFDWLKDIFFDKNEKYKLEGYKLGKSLSNLFFIDNFMKKDNNIFSVENANEGILHALFYLVLFISSKTPKFFAIDNIETALNPRLCRVLTKELIELGKINNKQVLVTTQNPAILDGLNLFDDDQRLFEVFRNQDGNTKTRRITFKKGLENKQMKLSEMWMQGLLGAVPKGF